MKIDTKKLLNFVDAISCLKCSFIKMYAENNTLQIMCSNGLIDIAYLVTDIEEKSKFSAILNASNLSKNLKAIENKKGEMELKNENNNVVAIGTGTILLETEEKVSWRFKKIPPDSLAVSLVSQDLLCAIQSVTNSLSNNGVLKFIKINLDNDNFTMTSFNGTLMSLVNLPLEDIGDIDSFSYLIDGNELKSIISLLKLVNFEIIDINIFKENEESFICFSSKSLRIFIKLNTDEFIHCDSLLNEKFDTSISFNVKNLGKSLLLASKAIKTDVLLKSDETKTILKNSSIGFETILEPIEKTEISINVPISLLKTLIGCINEENVVISKSEKGLIKISTESSDNITFITTESK